MTTVLIVFLLITLLSLSSSQDLTHLSIPTGSTIDQIAMIPHARSLSYGDGVLYVSSLNISSYEENQVPQAQPIRAVLFDDIFRVKKVVEVTQPLLGVNGIVYVNEDLYVAKTDGVLKFRNINKFFDGDERPVAEMILGGGLLPTSLVNGWRYLRYSVMEDRLYLSVGAPCNAPESGNRCDDNIYSGTIISFTTKGEDIKIVASGIRNSVGFDWDQNNDLWFTDNGRTGFPGKNTHNPPDELNKVNLNVSSAQAVRHYGFPYCYGRDLNDPTIFNGSCIPTYVGSSLNFSSHSVPLGVRHYSHNDAKFGFPESYRNNLLVAMHGSANRNPLTGYKVVKYNPENNTVEDLITGWLPETQLSCEDDSGCSGGAFCVKVPKSARTGLCSGWGRPVDIEVLPDGSIIVSDDHTGILYRLSFDLGRPWYVYFTIVFVFLSVVLGISILLIVVVSRENSKRRRYQTNL